MNEIACDRILELQGPILVIGVDGFLGSSLFRALVSVRHDVYGTFRQPPAWCFQGEVHSRLIRYDPHSNQTPKPLLEGLAPATIFHCPVDRSNPLSRNSRQSSAPESHPVLHLLDAIQGLRVRAFIHAGSLSECALNVKHHDPGDVRPHRDPGVLVDGMVTDIAISVYGREVGVPCIGMHFSCLYGPLDEPDSFVAYLASALLRHSLPPLPDPSERYDFLHVDDAVQALVRAAGKLEHRHYGMGFQVGSGEGTTIGILAQTLCDSFHIHGQPQFGSRPAFDKSLCGLVADRSAFSTTFGWTPEVALPEGMRGAVESFRDAFAGNASAAPALESPPPGRNAVSAIVACYKDEQAIPLMHKRLTDVLRNECLDYEIIFVNDGSPDQSTEMIRRISETDPHVLGIVHSRNFGSQSAFRSGMELATMEACILLDGDLQDPPEMIPAFLAKWREGADVVYGRRVGREMPWWLERFYKGFYRLFSFLGEVPIPRDAGDFSLMDKTLVKHLLACPERDYFLRGLRAYVGFRQEGVDYVRPERAFGVSTNNWMKNIGWAKKAIFSFSRVPLHMITTLGFLAIVLVVLLTVYILIGHLFYPDSIPVGITTGYLLTMAFGSANLFALGLLGEYVGKIIEETKARPPFIRSSRIYGGRVDKWE